MLTIVLAGGAAAMAQKAQTPEDLDKVMKKLAPANGAVTKAIQSMAYADAKKQLEVVESLLEDAHNFGVVNKKDDPINFSKDAMARRVVSWELGFGS
jgi:hypothetical protein